MFMTHTEDLKRRLEVSENKFRRLFEAAQDGILLIDPTTRKITDVNPYLLNLIGYSQEEMIGKELWEIGAFKDIEKSKLAFKELMAKQYIRYDDLPLRTKKGDLIEVEFVSNRYAISSSSSSSSRPFGYEDMPLITNSGDKIPKESVADSYPKNAIEMIQCNIRDITDRKKLEKIARTYLSEIENTNKLLAERQASMIDIGNTMNLSDIERIDKIMASYAESLEIMNKLIQNLKTKTEEANNQKGAD